MHYLCFCSGGGGQIVLQAYQVTLLKLPGLNPSSVT